MHVNEKALEISSGHLIRGSFSRLNFRLTILQKTEFMLE